MTVFDFCELLTEAAIIEIYNIDNSEMVYNGYSDELPAEIGDVEILSIDPVYKESKHLTINI